MTPLDLGLLGIVHGTYLNYDNDVVASKAWNLLFAVADWAEAREKESKAAEPKPTPKHVLKELWTMLSDNAKFDAAAKAFVPVTLQAGQAELVDHPAYNACDEYLTWWTRRNYGFMANAIARTFRTRRGKKMAGQVSEEYKSYALEAYEIVQLEQMALAACVVQVKITVNGDEKIVSLRWIYEDDDGSVRVSPSACWRLMNWVPLSFLIQDVSTS